MLHRTKHKIFLERFRWTLLAQNVFGVSSLTIDNKGRVKSGNTAPKLILMIIVSAILVSTWFIYYNNESAVVCKSNAKKVVLFYYFVIIETLVAIGFNVISTIRIAWPSSQKSLAQCWEQLIAKVQDMHTLYNCSIESKRSFQLFWLWLCILSISYCIFLTYMVLSSTVRFVVQTNHFIMYGLRIYAYLSHTTLCASFGLFAMLLRILIVEMKRMIHQTVSETQLRSMIQLYRHILQIIESFCAVYGWVLLLIFFEHFLILTDRSFFAVRMYRATVGFSSLQVLSMMLTWVFPLTLNDMMLIGACTATEKALQEFEKQLCSVGKTMTEDTSDFTFMITSFSLYVAEQKPKFRILKSLNLNFSLLYGSCGIVATYLTVFLQFDSYDTLSTTSNTGNG
uniref:Gustatory receptor n=1 Tax=Anopheles funestus TaxID=62324 RepID=A0A182RYH7_ANOFN